jgi:hypothetical protein
MGETRILEMAKRYGMKKFEESRLMINFGPRDREGKKCPEICAIR